MGPSKCFVVILRSPCEKFSAVYVVVCRRDTTVSKPTHTVPFGEVLHIRSLAFKLRLIGALICKMGRLATIFPVGSSDAHFNFGERKETNCRLIGFTDSISRRRPLRQNGLSFRLCYKTQRGLLPTVENEGYNRQGELPRFNGSAVKCLRRSLHNAQ